MKLYWKHVQIHLHSMMQYKTSFFMTVIGQFLASFNIFLGMFFMFQRFHQVDGYTYGQCLLCFAVTLTSFTLAEVFFRGFDMFAVSIANGEFDRNHGAPQRADFPGSLQKSGADPGRQTFAGHRDFLLRHSKLRGGMERPQMFGADSHADRRHGGICLLIYLTRRHLLFHPGRVGSHEYIHKRGTGIRAVSLWNLWEAGASDLHLSGAVCAVSVLSVSLFNRASDRGMAFVSASGSLPVFHSVRFVLETGRAPL